MGRHKLGGLADDIKALARELKAGLGEKSREVQAVYQRLRDFAEQMEGHLQEFGQQLFAVHVVQEMLLEKVGITRDDVKARIDAREAALAAQQKALEEAAAAARKKAEAARAAAAETTEQPAIPAEVPGAQEAPQGPDAAN